VALHVPTIGEGVAMIPKRFRAEDAVQVLGQFADDLGSASLEQAFDGITPQFYGAIKDNFTKTRDSSSAIWPPHAPSTVQRYGPHPLLILSGRMLAASTQRGADGGRMEIGPRSMRAGVDIEYAKYQQFGTSRIPAREFYYVHEENLESIRKPFEDLCFELLVGT
jgi:hypothetical protein